ncbi:hypothetical protein C8J56DRAFT_11381 [Mycena floridula]|nr:hypothetical protein C8J56DRAFT_11381 [Mycena floridula]
MTADIRLEWLTTACSDEELDPLEEITLIPLDYKAQVNKVASCIDNNEWRADDPQIHSIEFSWGIPKDSLNLDCPLNRLSVRSDLKQLLLRGQCALVPKLADLREMEIAQEKNAQCALSERQSYLTVRGPTVREIFELTNPQQFPHESSELRLFSLSKSIRPFYVRRIDKSGQSTYEPFDIDDWENSPRIKATAHPFFITYFAHESLILAKPSSNAPFNAYGIAFSVWLLWTNAAPKSFITVPDVWKEHRHPLSDNGSCVRRRLKKREPEIPSCEDSAAIASGSETSQRLSEENLQSHQSNFRPAKRPRDSASSVPESRPCKRLCSDAVFNEGSSQTLDWLSSLPAISCFENLVESTIVPDDDDLEPVRLCDEAILYGKRIHSIQARGTCHRDTRFHTSSHWALEKYKVRL